MAVYVIRAGEAGPVKIGVARSVEGRLRSLQTGSHEILTVVRSVPGGRVIESWLHKRFDHLRLRGEWFRFDAEMMTVEPPVLADAPGAPANSQAKCVIAKFGGQTALARALGLNQSVVSRWAASGWIPSRRLPDIFDAARALSIGLTNDDMFPPHIFANFPAEDAA